MKLWLRVLLGLSLPAAIIVLWWLATSYGSIPRQILPTPRMVLSVYINGEERGKLLGHLLVSLRRVGIGFFMASVFGILLGVAAGISKICNAIILPTLTAVRQIPIIAWIPLLILWCGIGEFAKIVLVCMAAFFGVFINTQSGVSETPVSYLEVARLNNLSKGQTIILVYLPYALPQILTGLQIGMGISWMAVVASELISATSGIGYFMSDARFYMRSDIMIACMLVIGTVGISMNSVLLKLFSFITPWKAQERKTAGKVPSGNEKPGTE